MNISLATTITESLHKSAEFKNLPQALQNYILQFAIEIAARTPGSIDIAVRMAEGMVEVARTAIANEKEEKEKEARIKEKLLEFYNLNNPYAQLTPAELRKVEEIDQQLKELAAKREEIETKIEQKTVVLDTKSLQDLGKKISETTTDEFKQLFAKFGGEERKAKANEYLPDVRDIRDLQENLLSTLTKEEEKFVEKGKLLHKLEGNNLLEQMEELQKRVSSTQSSSEPANVGNNIHLEQYGEFGRFLRTKMEVTTVQWMQYEGRTMYLESYALGRDTSRLDDRDTFTSMVVDAVAKKIQEGRFPSVVAAILAMNRDPRDEFLAPKTNAELFKQILSKHVEEHSLPSAFQNVEEGTQKSTWVKSLSEVNNSGKTTIISF